MSHHFGRDLDALRCALASPVRYIGLLGSRERCRKLVEGLGRSLTTEEHARLYAPVGLDVGAQGPQEIALAVAAELLSALRGRRGAPLRERREALTS